MMRKRLKRGGTTLLALALAFSTLLLPEAKAAEAVKTDEKCSISFSIAGAFKELETVPVSIELYKVADINVSGDYKALAGFEDLKLEEVDSKTTAAEWAEKAKDAADVVEKEGLTAAETVTSEKGKAAATDLDTGMYLVYAQTAQSDYYEYTFIPYLVSLPDNRYYTSGNDTWIYDIDDLALKPEQSERLGDLEIQKTLENQNVTMGEKATFVFQIAVTTPKGKTETKTAAITFDAAGSDTAVITGIPAGSQIQVTEVYSGASYELVSSQGTAQIVADDMVSTSFTNRHNGEMDGGYGVVNNYRLNENNQYEWTQMGSTSEGQEE